MAKKSISDFYNFLLFIFDLDNTIYNEEDYLFQAYSAICDRFAGIVQGHDKKSLFSLMMQIYRQEGRDNLFDKFLSRARIGGGYLEECLKILRTFSPEKQIEMYPKSEKILRFLIEKEKKIYVLTNGNSGQQKNKIRNLLWKGLDEKITFIMANDIEPKPSPAGIEHILKIAGIAKDNTVFVGDSEIDRKCAALGKVKFVNIAVL
jgi:HAD superfamily hydrolase (TIGR01549 family)